MSMLTPWGYTISDADALGNILTADEFEDFTAGKYSGDTRTESNLAAVSTAIRNYCGWHVYPSCECLYTATLWDGRLTRRGNDLIVQLPARFVTDITGIVLDGTELSPKCSAGQGGLVKLYGVGSGVGEYAEFQISYAAGISDAFSSAIKELAAYRVIHALTSSAGVQSETIGAASITYSASWINSAGVGALADDSKAVLAPYRLQGVF